VGRTFDNMRNKQASIISFILTSCMAIHWASDGRLQYRL
jgi:hypothetical protein